MVHTDALRNNDDGIMSGAVLGPTDARFGPAKKCSKRTPHPIKTEAARSILIH